MNSQSTYLYEIFAGKIMRMCLQLIVVSLLHFAALNVCFVQERTLPYIIGLTGSAASGKSSVCARLERLGAVIIDCDQLGKFTVYHHFS